MKRHLALLVSLFALVASCKSQSEISPIITNGEAWHPIPIEVQDLEVFSCMLDDDNLIIEKKSEDLDELGIRKPNQDNMLAVIINSPAVVLSVVVTPDEFLMKDKIYLNIKELQGYSLLDEAPKPELIFDQAGEYEVLVTRALESDEPRFFCRVNFDADEKHN